MLKRVLIVDDEEIVRRGLVEKVPWGDLAMEPVAPASNGVEALHRLETESVDIVVTDILMPAMDGMDLIREATRRGFPARFIVLSGHGEFEFARRAMQCGVKQYVLKPTRMEDLTNALRQASDEIDADQGSDSPEVLRMGTVRKLLAGRYSRQTDAGKIRSRLEIDPETQRVALVEVDLGETVAPARAHMIGAIAAGVLRSTRVIGAVECTGSAILVVAATTEYPVPEEFELLVEKSRRLRTPKVVITYSATVPVWDLPGLYDSVISDVPRGFYRRSGTIRCHGDTGSPVESFDSTIEKFLEEIRAGNLEAAETSLEALTRAAHDSCVDPAEFRRRIVEGLVDTAEAVGIVIDCAACERADAIADFQELVDPLIKQLAAASSRISHTPQERAVRAIKSAVHRRFQEQGLSLKSIAASEVFGNVDYLSRVFRKATGIRFSRYLLHVRMNEAERLLLAFPTLSVRDIARRVGYGENAQYFSHSFHRFFSVTPSEYRDRSGNEPS